MKKYQVKCSDIIISSHVRGADNFLTRLCGYMFRSRPTTDDGILFEPGNSIHTFFMRFNIDVIFLKKDGTIVKIIRDLKPWRMTWIYSTARMTLELPAGKLPSQVKEGSKLEVTSV